MPDPEQRITRDQLRAQLTGEERAELERAESETPGEPTDDQRRALGDALRRGERESGSVTIQLPRPSETLIREQVEEIEGILQTSPVEDFAGVDEPGSDALVGTAEAALIPEGGDVMVYGDGGASKTTLSVDLACHLAAGDDWLGNEVPRAVNVLLIENEGPRPPFRKKLRRKLDGWEGSDIGERLQVLNSPWGEITFKGHTDDLTKTVRAREIDVLIAGPVTRLGMEEAGNLQHVRDFLMQVHKVRRECGRRLTVILVHHESKSGAVSGAWEGSGDTLIHLAVHSRGQTDMRIQKARWSSEHHEKKLKLKWTDGEGFEVEDDRDYATEIALLLSVAGMSNSGHRWLTTSEIANKKTGIGASRKIVEKELKDESRFEKRKGDEVGRSPKAVVYSLVPGRETSESSEQVEPS